MSVMYWGGGGKYQKEFEELFAELVPVYGEASTMNGEVLRSANKLYCENMNNGNCNVSWDGEIREDFIDALEILNKFFEIKKNPEGNKIVDKIYDIYYWSEDYNSANDETYERLIDLVMEHLLEERK